MKSLCVLGLGYIGLPTAALFASKGWRVLGVDLNDDVVAAVGDGEIHIEEPGLADLVRSAVASGALSASGSPDVADAYIIAVPTPVYPDGSADMRAVEAAVRSILPHLRPSSLVVLESTSPPGTTDSLVVPILEESGLAVGTDLFVAYSPERVLPGRIIQELVENDRVVGGVDKRSSELARQLYETVVDAEVHVTDAATAEAVKLMENSFRDVNIALANEFAMIAEELGVDVWKAIALANMHPRVDILRPGPGVGGHCIAVDPYFLISAAPGKSRLLPAARRVNDEMPKHVVRIVAELCSPGARICGLGVAFKADVDDVRGSPAAAVLKSLRDEGFDVVAYDPHCGLEGIRMAESLAAACDGADLAVLLVDHRQFKSLAPADLEGLAGRTVVDTRSALDEQAWRSAGFDVVRLGVGRSRAVPSRGVAG